MFKEKYEGIRKHIAEAIKGSKFENKTYAVGGCIRDIIMKKRIKDIDIVIALPNGGIELAQYLEDKGLTDGKVVTYQTYGTAMFRLKAYPDEEIECVETRKEQYKDKESRNPEVAYGTIEEDAFRRDLTINALYQNVSTGEIIDPTKMGLLDIVNKKLRVTNDVPDTVFIDDPLRILRVIRFYSRFRWEIDEDTYKAMERNSNRLSIITKERIHCEFNKILSPNAEDGISMISSLSLWEYILPIMEEMKKVKYDSDCTLFDKTMGIFHPFNLSSLPLIFSDLIEVKVKLAALLYYTGYLKYTECDENGELRTVVVTPSKYSFEYIRKALTDLKYSNCFISEVKFLAEHCNYFVECTKDPSKEVREKDVRRLQYLCKTQERMRNLIILAYMVNGSDKVYFERIGSFCEMDAKLTIKGTDMYSYVMPVNGNDILNYRKDLKEGPEIKKLLDRALKICFNNPKISKERLLKELKKKK